MKASQILSDLQHATALASIRGASRKHVGLAPKPEPTDRLVAAVPIDPTENPSSELDYALEAAVSYWPDCTDWSILGCDEVSDSNSIPPDFVVMQDPESCGLFSSYGGY